jgi:hypothetical protein
MKKISHPGASRQLAHSSTAKRNNKSGKRVGKSTIVISKSGPSCPRCRRPTQVRTHAQVGPKQLRQPYYFKRWYFCTNYDCRTTLIMEEQDKKWNDNARARKLQKLMNRRGESPKIGGVNPGLTLSEQAAERAYSSLVNAISESVRQSKLAYTFKPDSYTYGALSACLAAQSALDSLGVRLKASLSGPDSDCCLAANDIANLLDGNRDHET